MNVIYQIERLPLMLAFFIHGGVLYFVYLITYLLNNWLAWNMIPLIVFSIIFIVCYIAIWMIIYAITKHTTDKINKILQKNRGYNSQ